LLYALKQPHWFEEESAVIRMEDADETQRTCDDVRNRIPRHGSEFWRTMLQIRGRATIIKNHSSL
jgi:hypothetical protein